MDSIEKSKEKLKQLFDEDTRAPQSTDPDFEDILNRFIFGEVFYQGHLDNKIRELIAPGRTGNKVKPCFNLKSMLVQH